MLYTFSFDNSYKEICRFLTIYYKNNLDYYLKDIYNRYKK